MTFSSKEVKRAIRDLENAASDLLNASYATHKARVNRLIELLESNLVLIYIVKPLLEMPVDTNEIEQENDLYLPTNINEQIAYILQLLKRASNNQVDLDIFGMVVFGEHSASQGIFILNNEVIRPCLRELLLKLEDLIEDEVAGKEQINPNNLQIFNWGNISANGGNIAIGQDISQKIEVEHFPEKIVSAFLNAGFSLEKIDAVRPAIEQLDTELKKKEVEVPVLKRILAKIYEIGEKSMIQIITNLITKPEIISAANEFVK